MKPRIAGVIPARWGSSRFPGKPLADLKGKPMVVRVFERASRAAVLDTLIVATDDGRIGDACRAAGIPFVMTAAPLPSGSDRVHAALAGTEYDIAVNIQGDEPLLRPEDLDALVAPLVSRFREAAVATLVTPLVDSAAAASPHLVKAVCNREGRALYFSRSPVPAGEGPFLRHLGLYAFTRTALDRFVTLPAGTLEVRERLEQLRLLENGIPVWTTLVPEGGPAVDTPGDLERVLALL
jgi:3-deoxy-manno-octulosonate cytidylyltransferase (CMP-KDO synthetase)